jgi:hypothetical protein
MCPSHFLGQHFRRRYDGFVRFACLAVIAGCHAPPAAQPRPIKTNNGGALLISMQPANKPRLDGAYDFELLAQGAGKACVKRTTTIFFWIGMNDLSQLAPDPLTQQAIAAAAYDAITHLEGADTIMLTAVTADSDDETQTCATVYGRGVRFTKRTDPVPPKPVESPAN